MSTPDERIAYVRDNRRRYLDELTAWVACPSISAQPEHAGDVRASAETAAARLRAAGLSGSVLETDAHPVAYGEWVGAPGAPTILIYGHHDVQPADPYELWTSPPFDATVRDGKIYGRGTVDDKGQVLMHVAALEAHLRVDGRLPLNVKVVVEGEEEIGSPNFESFLARERERLACDVVVVSDTAVFAEDVPSLTVSLRGLVHWEITVHGPASDLHSGYYGGNVRNPLEALAQILAALKDADGRVSVPGFYDGVRTLGDADRAAYARLPFDEAIEARALGVDTLFGETGYTPLERMWMRPTLEINGMYGGYQGAGAKTIVPSFARAKLSARLVPAQDPAQVKRVVTDFIRALAPRGVRVDVVAEGDVRAVETSQDHPAVAAAARAMERGFGKPPVFIGTGGTIGPVSSFDRILGLPQVLIGVGLPDDAIHAPNEKFDLAQFFGGIETMAYLYDELATALRGRAGVKSVDRFGSLAGAYVAARPSYPPESIDAIIGGLGDPALLVVADLGAGTGISSRLIASRGPRVLAVEPNAKMRAAADGDARVEWIDGTAEATGLAAASVDAVVAFQAWHWVDHPAAVAEARRVLKPGGVLAAVYNERDESDPFTAAFGSIVRRFALEPTEQHRSDALEAFASIDPPRTRRLTFRNAQDLDRAGVHRRAVSSSYLPQTGEAADAMHVAIDELLDDYPAATNAMRLLTLVVRVDT